MNPDDLEGVPRDTCRSCGADIVWAVTGGHKPLPVDADADADAGNVRVTAGPGITPHVTVLGPGKAVAAREDGEQLHTSHFATCTEAGKWRRRR